MSAISTQNSCKFMSDRASDNIPQEVISYGSPLQRVWFGLPVLLERLDLFVIQENPEILIVRRIIFLPRNTTPVNFLDICSTFSCVSTSKQVSTYWMECAMNLTLFLLEGQILDGAALASVLYGQQ